MRAPCVGRSESRVQGGTRGSRLTSGQRGGASWRSDLSVRRNLADQRNVGAVHAVVAADRGKVDHRLPRDKWVAPADPHLDRVIAQQEDRVGLSDQRHQDAVGLG